MSVIGDLRQKEFQGREFIYGEIIRDYPPYTRLILHAKKPKNPQGRVVKLKKLTVKRLRQLHPWKRGMLLLYGFSNRKNHKTNV